MQRDFRPTSSSEGKKDLQDIDNSLTYLQCTSSDILCMMNSLEPDLWFTLELERDFSNSRIQTLDFTLWLGTARLEGEEGNKKWRENNYKKEGDVSSDPPFPELKVLYPQMLKMVANRIRTPDAAPMTTQ